VADNAEFWVDIAWKAWTVALTLYVAINRSQDRLAERIEQVEKDMNGLGDRVTALTGEVRALPSMRDISDIHEKVNEAVRELSTLTGTVDSNEALLRAMHQHIMNMRP
jgi:pyridoxal/pyridoxine/pyridoxamine kinase